MLTLSPELSGICAVCCHEALGTLPRGFWQHPGGGIVLRGAAWGWGLFPSEPLQMLGFVFKAQVVLPQCRNQDFAFI